MKYIVECRRSNGSGIQYRGFGNGLPDKKIATEVFDREVKSGEWDAVYIDRLNKTGIISIMSWYKRPETPIET